MFFWIPIDITRICPFARRPLTFYLIGLVPVFLGNWGGLLYLFDFIIAWISGIWFMPSLRLMTSGSGNCFCGLFSKLFPTFVFFHRFRSMSHFNIAWFAVFCFDREWNIMFHFFNCNIVGSTVFYGWVGCISFWSKFWTNSGLMVKNNCCYFRIPCRIYLGVFYLGDRYLGETRGGKHGLLFFRTLDYASSVET